MSETNSANRHRFLSFSTPASLQTPAVTAIYARKSRPNKSALGSCEVQAAIWRDTVDAFSWEIKEVFANDGGSSETLDRPAMSRLIEQIELGVIRRLIVDRADRLSRKLHVTAKLMELLEPEKGSGAYLAVRIVLRGRPRFRRVDSRL